MAITPIEKVRNGSISIAVFDGKFGKSVIVQKSYKDKKTGKWVNNNINLFINEIKQLKDSVDEIHTKFKKEIDAKQLPEKK